MYGDDVVSETAANTSIDVENSIVIGHSVTSLSLTSAQLCGVKLIH